AGLEIRPSGTDSEGNEYAWTPFTYGGTLVFGEEETSEYVFPYAIYYDEIINDMNAKLIEQGEDELTAEEEKAYLAQAYAMNLEVRPFVKGLQANGDEYVSYGEADDTSRSLQGVALAYLLQDIVAEGSTEYNTLVGYIPGTYNEVAEEFKAEETFYSNYDATGVIPIDNAIPMENAKIYYGAKEVTDLYADGVVNLSGVQTKVTTDGTCSDYLTILDTVSGDVYKQEFVGVTLAIDEATDLDFFKQRTNLDCPTNDAASLVVDFGDLMYDGYYVLLNDIDCEGYLHDHTSGSKYNIASRGWSATIKNTIRNQGLMGTFDGRGYTIKNYTSTASVSGNNIGLFGYINGGTLKNTGFYNPNQTASSTGAFLAFGVFNGATIQDCYFYLGEDVAGAYASGFVVHNMDSDTTFKNNVYVVPISHAANAASSSIFYGGLTNVTDSYMISAHYAEIGGGRDTAGAVYNADGSLYKNESLCRVVSDAEFVNGVKSSGKSDMFYAAGRYDITYSLNTYSVFYKSETYAVGSTYDISTITGLKRYTTTAKMTEDKANNDFSSWNQDVWEIVDGIPTFRSTLSGDYSAFVNGKAIAGQSIGSYIGTEFDVAVEHQGASVGFAPEIAAVSGSEIVSINGTTVTASAAGTATIKVAYRDQSWQFTLNILATPTDLEQEYYFSAHDGQFYDEEFNVIALTEIFDKEITNVYDAKANKLNLVDGKIMGLDLGKQDTWAETYIVFETAEGNYKLSILGADLIIDETADFEYFGLNGTATIAENSFAYDGDDFVWDGYHVLVKDIDAKAYSHHTDLGGNNTGEELGVASMEAVADTNYGLSGVFDGQGHTIDRMFIDGTFHSGLFPIINGGTVKNVRFTNLFSGRYSTYIPSGVSNYYYTNAEGSTVYYQSSKYIFSTYMVNGGSIENVDINFHNNAIAGGSMLYHGADASSSVSNAMISVTKGATNTWGNYIIPSTKATLSNVYVIANMGLSVNGRHPSGYVTPVVGEGETAENIASNWLTVNFDAAKVDGVTRDYINIVMEGTTVYNLNEYTATTAEGGVTYSKDNPISRNVTSGVVRYTSLANMQADKATNDFSSWNSEYWAIVNGVPTLKGTLDGEFIVYAGDSIIDGEPMAMQEGDSFDIALKLGATNVENVYSIAITSGEEFVSLDGNTITAEAAGEAVITVTLGSKVWTLPLTILEGAKTYAEELYFSAHDGQFYDSNFGIVDVATIFGVDAVTLIGATDANGNALNVTDTNAVMGLDLGKQSTWAQTSITIMSDSASWIVNVKAADAIIDEATDLNVLKVSGSPEIVSSALNYAGDDFVKDGYYVVVDNIDASTYIFSGMASGTALNPTQVTAAMLKASGFGFSGVFDGQGYTVSGLSVTGWNGGTGYGLFGFVNNGTIKNVTFDALYNTTAKSGSVVANTGALAYCLVNEAKIQDVKIINKSTPGGSASSLLYYTSDATSSLNRVYIQDNSGTINVNSGAFWKSNSATFSEVYIVSRVPAYLAGRTGSSATIISRADGSATTHAQGTRFNYIIGDAEYVDGVLGGNTRDYVTVGNGFQATYKCSEWIITDSNKKTYGDNAPDYNYSISVLNGVKRYTTLEKMQADAANNTFTGWDSTLWTITNGVPSMNVIG
ncbi:MAG: hypothetical protein IKB98_06760, partial [Clostridia bacterium]|nr:hypothetical protein [Clostridia bacterium]